MVVPCATGWLCFSKRRRRHRRSLRASTRLEEEEGEEGDQADAACSSRCWPEEEGKDEEPSGWVFYREQSEMHARAVAALKRDHDRDIKRVLRRSEDLAREVVALRAQLADRHARRRALREDSGVDEPPVLQVATPVRTLHPKRRSSKKAKTNVQSDVVVKVTATRGKPKAVVVGTSVVSRRDQRPKNRSPWTSLLNVGVCLLAGVVGRTFRRLSFFLSLFRDTRRSAARSPRGGRRRGRRRAHPGGDAPRAPQRRPESRLRHHGHGRRLPPGPPRVPLDARRPPLRGRIPIFGWSLKHDQALARTFRYLRPRRPRIFRADFLITEAYADASHATELHHGTTAKSRSGFLIMITGTVLSAASLRPRASAPSTCAALCRGLRDLLVFRHTVKLLRNATPR
mmetsp:Transcript_17533/g.56885  ORF Transcript_17533/g.56885 Transcript_17533/m.56885 type:complete len:399 (+) Transcript_17533:55-1251(+)